MLKQLFKDRFLKLSILIHDFAGVSMSWLEMVSSDTTLSLMFAYNMELTGSF